MKKTFLLILTSLVFLAGCSKNEENLVPDDETQEVLKFITRDSPVGTIGMLDGVEGIVVELPAIKEGDGDTIWKASKDYPAKKVVIATKNVGDSSPEDARSQEMASNIYITYRNSTVWRLPHVEELFGLAKIKDNTWTKKGCRWTVGNSALFLYAGNYVSDNFSIIITDEETYYGLSINTNVQTNCICRILSSNLSFTRLFHDMPEQ